MSPRNRIYYAWQQASCHGLIWDICKEFGDMLLECDNTAICHASNRKEGSAKSCLRGPSVIGSWQGLYCMYPVFFIFFGNFCLVNHPPFHEGTYFLSDTKFSSDSLVGNFIFFQIFYQNSTIMLALY